MRRLAEDLELLDGFPPFSVNIYVMGGVLVDSGTRFAFRRIVRQLRGRSLTAHALTHAHPDHQGASHRSASCSDCRCGGAQPTPWRWKRQARSWPGCRPTGSVPPLVRTGSVPRTLCAIFPRVTRSVGSGCSKHRTIRSVMSRSGASKTGVLVLGDVLANMHIWTGLRKTARTAEDLLARSRQESAIGLTPG